MLDRVDETRRGSIRAARSHDDAVSVVEVLDHEDVATDDASSDLSRPLALIQKPCGPCAPRGSRTRGPDRAGRMTAKVPSGEKILHGDGDGRRSSLSRRTSRLADVGGHFIAVPHLGLEVGIHSLSMTRRRRCERLEPLKIAAGSSDLVRALVHRREPYPLAWHAEKDDVQSVWTSTG